MINIIVYVIVAVIIFVALRSLTKEKSKNGQKTTVPGLTPCHPERGNLDEIGSAGSLHEFLVDLHRRYGHIASFWMGKQLVVSVASPDLFKKLVPVFDKPPEMFSLFKPMFGQESLVYKNNDEGRAIRHHYDKPFSHASLKQYYDAFREVSEDVADQWSALAAGEHVSVHKDMVSLAIKAISVTAFGEFFKDNTILKTLRHAYDTCWSIMEESLTKGFPEPGSETFQKFESGRKMLYETVGDLVIKRREFPPDNSEKLFIDYLLDFDQSVKRIICDSVTYMIGGFHTTGNMLTWSLYYLAANLDIQDRVAREIKEVLGDAVLDETNISKLKYLRQIQEETLRCSVLAPWGARLPGQVIELGGHVIAEYIPIICALGVLLQDEAFWPEPSKFDPERFSPENTKKRPAHTFSPFGVAGKRICPGYRFAYSETAVVLVTLLRRFRLKLVEGQDIHRVYGFVTHPSQEIWLTLEKRQ